MQHILMIYRFYHYITYKVTEYIIFRLFIKFAMFANANYKANRLDRFICSDPLFRSPVTMHRISENLQFIFLGFSDSWS